MGYWRLRLTDLTERQQQSFAPREVVVIDCIYCFHLRVMLDSKRTVERYANFSRAVARVRALGRHGGRAALYATRRGLREDRWAHITLEMAVKIERVDAPELPPLGPGDEGD